MRSRSRLLTSLSAEHLRHLTRRFTLAGWTGADVLHALDHEVAGRQHGYHVPVRYAPGWIRARLALWLDPQGKPLPSRTQRVLAERERIRAEQSARRSDAVRAAERAAAVDVPSRAAELRAIVSAAARRPRP